jgi:hypothetical protein
MGKSQSNFQNSTIFGVPLIAANLLILFTNKKNFNGLQLEEVREYEEQILI